MGSNTISEAPEGAKFLSDFMTELPVNCLFNKGITGCGGTELALSNKKHTIIAMPFISLVRNKVENERHVERVLGVDGDTHVNSIVKYIASHEVWKIAVVYDSLPKVIEVFQSMNINPFEECHLLVDEYHILFNQYVFRGEAIRKLLKVASDFKETTYMSATPLCDEFILKELKGLPIYEVVWPNKKETTVLQQPTASPFRYTIDLIKDKLDDKIFGNLHFFVNSVKFIQGVLAKAEVDPNDVRIVCADNEENKSKLGDYRIGKPSGLPCKINFYTSTCFEGCDIFDNEGKIYVISEGRNPNTLYDISTLFIQIIGRIRDSEYNNEVVHVVSNHQYKGEVGFDEYKNMMKADYDTTQNCIISTYNSWDLHLRNFFFKRLGSDHFRDRFIHVDEEYVYSMDENLLNKNLFDYKIKTEVYNKSRNLSKAYLENGLAFTVAEWIDYSDKLKKNSKTKSKFKDVVEEYDYLVTSQRLGNNRERIALIRIKYNFIEDAYKKLGMDKIRELKYNIT